MSLSPTQFYGRRVKVAVQRVGAGLPVSIVGGVGDVTGIVPAAGGLFASVFDRLHVEFKAEKDNLGHPNTLDLTIYGLAERTRGQLQDVNSYVQLMAGYVGDWPNLPIVFQGNARTIDHVRKGAEWLTRIQCGDGELAYRLGFISQSFASGATAVQVATSLAQQVQAADPSHVSISAFLNKLPSVKFPVPTFALGTAIQGNAFEELQRLLGWRYELAIQDGELRVLALLEGTVNVVRVDPQHGLIESPVHGTPSHNGLPPALNVKSLLNARIRPGDLVRVEARNTSGTHRVQKLTHTGNLASNEWYTQLECVPIQSPLGVPV